MDAETEDLVDRYLEAVAAQLSSETRDDITAELRDLILSRFEAKEGELDRALSEDEREAILREIGHPLVVAARYRQGPDRLIGPELFPYWLYGVKTGLLVLLAVAGIGLFVRLIGGSASVGQALTQAFHGWFGSALTLIGVLTLAGATMEHYGIRPKWLTDWRVKDLAAFGLSDPATWGLAARTAAERGAGGNRPGRSTCGGVMARGGPGEAAFSLLAVGVFVLWWVGLLRFPELGLIRIDGGLVAVTPAPIWTALFAPILLYALGQMGVDLFTLIRPRAPRLRAVLKIALAGVGLGLTWVVLDAGHWFTLSAGVEQARIAGDWTMLDPDRLRDLGDGPRTLTRVASILSLILTWALAIQAVGLVFSIVANAWRAVRA